MVISKTPFRMSFFGGGTDYPDFFKTYGGSVLSTTFDKYCYVTARHLPKFFEYSSSITYSKVEQVNSLDEISHPAVRETMRYLKMRELHVGYEADLPARSGLGSSSSFVVGMLQGFYSLKGKCVDKKKLADDAIYVERILCKESGGIQDQIAASFGGFNRIDFYDGGYNVKPVVMGKDRKKCLNSNLMLFFTGFSRDSNKIAFEQERTMKNKISELKELLVIVDEAERILGDKTKNLYEFGRLLDYTWKIKRGLTVKITNDFIDRVYQKALGAGAVGGKLLGAGGGGFMLFYVEKDRQDDVKKALSGLLHVPFQFENNGASILYYVAEDV